MKRFALLPALFALLLAAVLTGAAFAQQVPPGQTLRQAGDMIPDASTIAAFAARTAGHDGAAQQATHFRIQWQPSLTDPRPRLTRPRRGTCFRIQSQPSLPDPRPWLTRPRQSAPGSHVC